MGLSRDWGSCRHSDQRGLVGQPFEAVTEPLPPGFHVDGTADLEEQIGPGGDRGSAIDRGRNGRGSCPSGFCPLQQNIEVEYRFGEGDRAPKNQTFSTN
jgi:hypothetical protein